MTGIGAKICGIKTADALQAAIDGGAQMVGFVRVDKSPRYVDSRNLRKICAEIPEKIAKIGLFTDPCEQEITPHVDCFDILQLHGKESPQRLRQLKAQYHLPVIKAISVTEDIAGLQKAIASYGAVADWLLFDAPAPEEGGLPGGNARVFSWSILQNLVIPVPWLLAGGLTPANVVAAIQQTNAPFVDVSSGVERESGVKDPDQIRLFLAEIHAYNQKMIATSPGGLLWR